MTNKYYHEFRDLEKFFLSDIREKAEKITEVVLNIDSCGDKHKLTLKNPKVPAMESTTIVGLFTDLAQDSVDSFKVFEEQSEPYDSVSRWRIEIWNNDGPKVGHTIHCRNIKGLP